MAKVKMLGTLWMPAAALSNPMVLLGAELELYTFQGDAIFKVDRVEYDLDDQAEHHGMVRLSIIAIAVGADQIREISRQRLAVGEGGKA